MRLRYAIYIGDVSLIRKIIDAGADPNERSKEGWTPLHGAISGNKRHEIIKTLIECGADPNARTMDGRTPLHTLASKHKSSDINYLNIRELVKGGANTMIPDNNGMIPLDYASRTRNKVVLRELIRLTNFFVYANNTRKNKN